MNTEDIINSVHSNSRCIYVSKCESKMFVSAYSPVVIKVNFRFHLWNQVAALDYYNAYYK